MSVDNEPSEQPRDLARRRLRRHRLKLISDGPWSRIGTPGKWSIGLGVALPVLGWLGCGDFTATGIVALLIVIPLWAAALRLVIYLGQRLFSR